MGMSFSPGADLAAVQELRPDTAPYLDERHEFFTRAGAAGHGVVCAIT
jgi:hypothetical protein